MGPNKYPLYKVYMGLIIKGTIPRVPAFSHDNMEILCFSWICSHESCSLFPCPRYTSMILFCAKLLKDKLKQVLLAECRCLMILIHSQPFCRCVSCQRARFLNLIVCDKTASKKMARKSQIAIIAKNSPNSPSDNNI